MSDKEFVLIGRCQSKTRDYIKHLESQNTKANEEIERLANIIKEARKYLEDKWKRDYYYEDIDNCCKFCEFSEFEYDDFLKILDKENK